MKTKKASLVHQAILHLILIGLIFGLFFLSSAASVSSRDVKQQVLEKQLALLIDSSHPGVILSISKKNINGVINKIELKQGKIFVYVEGLRASKGYGYFTRHAVSLSEDIDNFYIKIEEKKKS